MLFGSVLREGMAMESAADVNGYRGMKNASCLIRESHRSATGGRVFVLGWTRSQSHLLQTERSKHGIT